MHQNHLHIDVELGTARGLHPYPRPDHHIHISRPIRDYQVLATGDCSSCPIVHCMF
jgi:hypothetical protein